MNIEIPSQDQQMESIPREMYTVSGYEESNIEHYLKDKAQDELINRIAREKEISSNIHSKSREERVALIKEAFARDDIRRQSIAVESILYLPKDEQIELRLSIAKIIKKSFAEGLGSVEAASMISNAPDTERAALIREGFKQKNVAVQTKAVSSIKFAPAEDRTILIREAFSLGLNSTETAREIRFAPREEKTSLINEVFGREDIETQIQAANSIYYAPDEEKPKLHFLVSKKIREAFEKGDMLSDNNIVRLIEFATETDRSSLIQEAFRSTNRDIQIEATNMIIFAPKDDRASLIRQAFTLGLGDEIVKSRLYVKHPKLNTEKFKREEFEKDGSETTLIGGPMKNKLIIRHIEAKAFVSWQKIYENYSVWKNNDFDYVPVEPIQSYILNGDGRIDVFSGVLDLNLLEWKTKSGGIFENELTAQEFKIKSILESEGVEHGHPHDQNFCLRFFRDENGYPDITRVPRLYIIDFDKAVS